MAGVCRHRESCQPRLARRRSSAELPDLFDWLESQWASLLPFAWGQAFRLEDYADDGRYEVRAELPGLDPERRTSTLRGDLSWVDAWASPADAHLIPGRWQRVPA